MDEASPQVNAAALFMIREKSPHYSPEAKLDLRVELEQLDTKLSELKMLYEQYFTGLVPLPPDKQHADIKRRVRTLRKAPFKSSAMSYRLRALETRYSTLNTYWKRVMMEREAGTYFRDVFKANLRERAAAEEAFAQTDEGVADKGIRSLFDAYSQALERQQGAKTSVEYQAFRESLLKRASDFRAKHGDKRLSFKIVVKEGKVSVKAVVKEGQAHE